MPRKLYLFIFIAVLCLLQLSAYAESVGEYLDHEYKNHLVLLRSAIVSDHLKFDSNGRLTTSSLPAWLVYGGIHLEKVALSQDKLRFEGQRVAFNKDNSGNYEFIPLDKKRIQIEIHLGQPVDSVEEAQTLLKKIFVDGAHEEQSKPEMRRADDSLPTDAIRHMKSMKDGAVIGLQAPQALHTPEPEFSDEARHGRIQGTALFEVVIDKTGKVTRIKLDKALGHGLDENAFESLKQWRFRPGTLNGEPVAIEMKIEVSFNLDTSPGGR